jgi:hypothetical protein
VPVFKLKRSCLVQHWVSQEQMPIITPSVLRGDRRTSSHLLFILIPTFSKPCTSVGEVEMVIEDKRTGKSTRAHSGRPDRAFPATTLPPGSSHQTTPTPQSHYTVILSRIYPSTNEFQHNRDSWCTKQVTKQQKRYIVL